MTYNSVAEWEASVADREAQRREQYEAERRRQEELEQKNLPLTKISLIIQAIAILVAIAVWWKYTERKVWSFLGFLILGSIVGWLVSVVIVAPFIKTK